MHRLLSFGSLAVAGVRPANERLRGIARVESEGEAPATFAAGVTREPALAAKDSGDALRHGFAAPTARGHDGRAAEEIVARIGCVMLVEVTTTVAVTIAVVSEIHGCTSTGYAANAKIFEVT
jgi:hypothetical protein